MTQNNLPNPNSDSVKEKESIEKESLDFSPTQNDEEMAPLIKKSKKRTPKSPKIRDPNTMLFQSTKQKIGYIFLLLAILIVPTFFIVQSFMRANTRPLIGVSDSFFIWQEDQTTRVDMNYLPISNFGTVNNSVSFSASRNEYESIQLVLRAFKTPQNPSLSFSISGFMDSNSIEVIPASNITLQQIEIIRDTFYDRMIHLDNLITLKSSENVPILITTYVPMNTSAGIYTSILTITPNEGASITINISLRVYNVIIPVQREYESMINPMTTKIPLMKDFYSHRMDFAGVPMTFMRNSTTHAIEFNWTEWDELTTFALNNGQQCFKISDPWELHSMYTRYSTEYNQTMQEYYTKVAQHLIDKGWLDLAYIYDLDEPNYQACVDFEPLCLLIHAVNPNLRILLTTAPDEKISFLFDDIDIWAPIEHDVPKYYAKLQELQDLGAEVVYYPCLFPKSPYANLQIYNPLLDTRVLAWQVFRWELDGFLYWHTMAYYMNMRGYGYNGWLDGWLLYEVDAEIGSYDSSQRWETLRDGFEDISLFYQLKAKVQHGNITDPTDARVKAGAQILVSINDALPDFRAFSRNPIEYNSIRNSAAELLESWN